MKNIDRQTRNEMTNGEIIDARAKWLKATEQNKSERECYNQAVRELATEETMRDMYNLYDCTSSDFKDRDEGK